MSDKKKKSTIKPKASVKRPAKAAKEGTKKGGFNLAPLISAVLLAGIKLTLEQKKLANKCKPSKTTSKTASKTK